MVSALPDVRLDELDGIPALWTSGQHGPYAGGLSFRVGVVDERLQTRGITHLIEHLAHTQLPDEQYHENAAVAGCVTHFYACGEPEEVAAHLTRIAATLADLPLHRLDAERKLLQVEESGVPGSIPGELAGAAYGLRGPGLLSARELGVPRLTADDIAAHLARFFTRGNAALWFTGPPPEGLRLVLPDGPRRVPLVPEPLPLSYPTWVEHELGQTVALGFTGAHDPALVAAVSIAERRAFRRLRFEQGLSYEVSVSRLPLAAGLDHYGLGADAHEDRDEDAKAVRDELIEVVRELAGSGPTEQELTAATDRARRMYAYSASLDQDGWLEQNVFDTLVGLPLEAPAQRQSRWLALTPDDVAGALAAALSTLVVAGPESCPPPDGVTPRPPGVHPQVAGETHKLFGPMGWLRGQPKLIAGDDGLTFIARDGAATVRFDDCAALLTWKNGERVIVGNDGASFPFDAEAFRNGGRLAALIDRCIGPTLRIPMDEIAARPFD